MTTVTTQSTIDIDRSALDIYNFVATPDNWVGSHPVTESVTGTDTDQVAGVGATWTERIVHPGETDDVDAVWAVLAAEPGQTWVIESAQFGGQQLDIKITYTLSEAGGVTHFVRDMESTTLGDRLLSEGERERLTSPVAHDGYLARVKELLEQH